MFNDNNIIQAIKSSIRATEPQAIIVLYGSYARGDNKENSDIDVLILLEKDKVTWNDERRISFPLYNIEFDTGKIISPLILSKKDWETKHHITPFYQNVIKEGKTL